MYVIEDYRDHVPVREQLTSDGVQKYMAHLQTKKKVHGHLEVHRVKGSFMRFSYYCLKTFFRAKKVPWPLEKEDVPKLDTPKRPYYCYDQETEVLTNEGWKRFVDLSGFELVMARLGSGEAEFVRPSSYWKASHKGPMYAVKTDSTDFMVTPTHRMFIGTSRRNFRLSSIEGLAEFAKLYLSADVDWNCAQQTEFVIPAEETRTHQLLNGNGRVFAWKEIRVAMTDWVRFLGWFLSEGDLHGGGDARIGQTKYKNAVRRSLATLGLKWNESKAGKGHVVFEICDARLSRLLARECYTGDTHDCYHKKVPKMVKDLEPHLINVFLEAFALGDGSRSPRGSRVYATTSRTLADDLQELILKSGHYATVTVTKSRELMLGTKLVRTAPLYRLNERMDAYYTFKGEQIKQVDYEGLIGCVTIPSHVILTRRNGKVMWSGNSYEEMDKVFGAIEKEKNIRDWLAFRVEALAFNRRKGLTELRRWDYDKDTGVLRLPSIKRGRIVTLELDKQTRKTMDVYLSKRTDAYPALFPSLRSRDDSGAMDPASWNMLLRKYCDIAGVQNKGMHAWRRGMVSYLKWVGGKSEREIFEMGDWLKQDMVFIYTQLAPDFATTERRKVHPFYRTQTIHDQVPRKTEKAPEENEPKIPLVRQRPGLKTYGVDDFEEVKGQS